MPPPGPTRSASGSIRTSSALALLIASTALAQGAPPPRAPQVLTARVRVHVRVHEDLKPDLLRGLALPQVTAWVDTRSNTLRASTLEHLKRFDDAFVRVRLPVKPADAAAFARLPGAGLWVSLADADRARLSRIPGGRRVAVEVQGPLDEATIARLRAARPTWIRWTPPPSPSLLEWGLFAQLEGRKVVVLSAQQSAQAPCDTAARAPSAELPLATLLARSSDVFPCGRALAVAPLDTDQPTLARLVVAHPGAELVLEVGADEERARAARALLGRLGLSGRR